MAVTNAQERRAHTRLTALWVAGLAFIVGAYTAPRDWSLALSPLVLIALAIWLRFSLSRVVASLLFFAAALWLVDVPRVLVPNHEPGQVWGVIGLVMLGLCLEAFRATWQYHSALTAERVRAGTAAI